MNLDVDGVHTVDAPTAKVVPYGLHPASALGGAIATALRQDTHSALLVTRIRNFRPLAETLGEAFGDSLGRSVESRIRACLCPGDTAVRIANDEFAVVPGHLSAPADASSLARRLLDGCCGSYHVAELNTHAAVEVGIALCSREANDPHELVRQARIALQGAEREGQPSYHIYSKGLLQQQQRRLWLESELALALSEQRFLLHYQPQYNCQGTEIIGMEALVRMLSPTGELIPPRDFIPIAERNGFIVPLGEWVIREACEQLAAWRAAGCAPRRMAVNVSPFQLQDESLVHTVSCAVKDFGLDYSDLELEITEQSMLEDSSTVRRVIEQVHSRGVRIAIDDFGTGFSSFSQLSRLPCDTLKLDRSFLSDVHRDGRASRVINAIIALAAELGFDVVAEGVETREQREFLRNSACDLGQGFGLARPQHANQISQLLQRVPHLRAVI